MITYNVYNFDSSAAFRLAIDVEPVSTIDKCSVAIISPCVAYTGPGHSNMAVLEITMPSGYEPDRDALFELANKDNTSKVYLIFYSKSFFFLFFVVGIGLSGFPIKLHLNI